MIFEWSLLDSFSESIKAAWFRLVSISTLIDCSLSIRKLFEVALISVLT